MKANRFAGEQRIEELTHAEAGAKTTDLSAQNYKPTSEAEHCTF
jgi:hypothetical protein